jgi:hypothetical protein
VSWAYRTGSYANNGVGAAVPHDSTTTVTLSAAVSAGDLLVLHVVELNTVLTTIPTVTVSDSVNGAWGAADDTVTDTAFSRGERQSVFSFPNSGAGTPVITVTVGNTGADAVNVGLQCLAFSGIVTTSPKDVAAHAIGTSSTPSSGATGATGAANELVLGFYGDYGDNVTITEGSGYTLAGKHQSDGGKYEALAEYKDSGSSGSTPSADATLSAGGGEWSMFAVVYKATAGAPPAQDVPELRLGTQRQMHQLLAQ